MAPRLEQRFLREVLGDGVVAGDAGAEPNQSPSFRIEPCSLVEHRRHDHISRSRHADQRRFRRFLGVDAK
jgi:hypothetical protein